MQVDRRNFLKYAAASGLMSACVSSDLQGASEMYGLIVKMTIVPGKREEMIRILKESAADMPGCFSYVVAKDAMDENVIWVTEVWDSVASHDGSLSLPQVKNRHVIHRQRRARMHRSEHLLPHRQRPFIQRLRVIVLPLVGVKTRQIVQRLCRVRMLGSQRFLPHRQCSFAQRLRVVIFALAIVKNSQVVQ